MKNIRGQRAYDLIGSTVIVNFPREFKTTDKKKFALNLMKEQKGIKTVLEKIGKIKGRLRKLTTKYIAGEKTKEVLYRENRCVFRFNLDSTYFSPRLSNERKELANKIKKGEEVLVMFAGVAPFSIVIAKNSQAKIVYSSEINKLANKYAKLNVELNKLKERVIIIPGDSRKTTLDFYKKGKKFDVIVMPRPRLKDNFLDAAFLVSKKNTQIYYYDFCSANEIDKIKEKIFTEAKKAKKKIKILKIKRAGEIAPYKIRVRVDFRVL
ncbi:MAG: hypothetical protein AABX30_02670 [Nanoarchaeota archaeon]